MCNKRAYNAIIYTKMCNNNNETDNQTTTTKKMTQFKEQMTRVELASIYVL